MMPTRTYNIYCDESCHVEGDRVPVMIWGAIWCEANEARAVTDQIRNIKRRHALGPTFETKWTKVSPAKIAYYEDLIDFFFADSRIKFRGLVVPDKSKLDHQRFHQTHNDWYYKMYFMMLKYIISPSHKYRIYLDVKDTRGGPKTRELHDVLANTIHDFQRKSVERVEQIRSHESELLQLADLLIGAVGYANRKLESSPAKMALVARLSARLGARGLVQTSGFSATKFNLLVWNANEAAA